MVTMEGQANNVNIKVKSLVHVDDDTATDGVENITWEGKKITNICPPISDNVTTTGGGGNSYGMILTLPL